MKRPLIAILRGVKPDEVEDIVSVLIESGMTAIEIPLSSPDPFRSIEIAAKRAPAGILVGAGAVLTLEAVERLHDVGGRLRITPNVDPEIIARSRARGMVTMPGVFTPMEASQRRGTWRLSFIENADRQRSAFMSFVNVWMAFNGRRRMLAWQSSR